MKSAELVAKARERAGLSRTALAAKADVPTSTVTRIESGQSEPTLPMLERLIAAAGGELRIEVADAPAATPTIAALANAVPHDHGRLEIDWTRLRGFADWARQHPSEVPAAVADPPARTNSPLDPILAAFAEELTKRARKRPPNWTRTVPACRQEWTPPGTPRMVQAARAATPESFRRRNVVLDPSTLFRVAK